MYIHVARQFGKPPECITSMALCGDNVWVASRAGLEFGQLDIYSASTRQVVHRIRMKNTAVSCITCSDTNIYIGTLLE